MVLTHIYRPIPKTEPLQRRLRPRKNRHSGDDNTKIPSVYQETVFAIPELLDLITGFLARDDLRVLIRVCRTWNAFWAPYLYSDLFLCKYKKTRVYPKVRTYGHYVEALELNSTTLNNILYLLDYVPNLQSLSLHHSALSLIQLQSIIAMVPQLRGLHLSFKRILFKPQDCPLTLAASLQNLEQFSWMGIDSEIRVDDILFVLKSCLRLRSLCLSRITLVEELPELPRTMVKVEDHDWQNTSLRRLECNLVLLGPRQTKATEPEDVHPCIRRLVGLQYVQLWPLGYAHFHHAQPTPSKITDALNTIAKYCDNLKVLDVKNTFPTTDDMFKEIMERNHQLQRVCVKNTDIGDLPLQMLARLPASCTAHNLVELDLEGCIHVTSAGITPVLENCGRLQNLNIARTKAATLNLFKGNKPWACRTSLEILRIDIQPQDYQPPPRMVNWIPVSQQGPPVIPYSPEEQLLVKERLTSFTSLRALDIKGLSMEFGMLDDMSFAPHLRQVILHIPFRQPGDGSQYEPAQAKALEWGRALFPEWHVWTGANFAYSTVVCMINAKLNYHDETFVLW
ncbi:hypothetical protein BG011_001119 [Mortierella polycephala]|uniref:F-box domain-containing protein n=1 Tax=Mortierella polycephala TaxID=41804 RepID=A0A9P6PLF7_9FUNG|nr:hypothetical protein BG011_001119 [Mortierella polycephala]